MGENTYSYNYDPIGNRLQSTVDSGQLSVTNSYTANGLNQYTSIDDGTAVSPIYDDDGNMTFLPSTSGGGAGGEGWHCQWDAENRLVSASNLTTAVVCNFIYDHHSRRISKTTLTPDPISSLTSDFTYDGWNLIQETTLNSQFSITNLYVWGLDLSGTLQGAGGVGGLLSQTVIKPSSVKRYLPLADANGNYVTYSDEAGNVQAYYVYDSFGGTVSSDGDMDDYFRLRFSSKYLDDETGLYYYGVRYFSPELGRWLNLDPIGELGGLLLYGFVGNDGVNELDVSGFMTYPKRTRDEAASYELYFDPDWEWESTGNQTTYWGWQLTIPHIGFGFTSVSCCDEKLIKRKINFIKICNGGNFNFNIGAGVVAEMDAKDCKEQGTYDGYFVETGVSLFFVRFGADIGLNKAGPGGILPGTPSGVNEAGLGFTTTPELGASAGMCYYFPFGSEEIGCCDPL